MGSYQKKTVAIGVAGSITGRVTDKDDLWLIVKSDLK